MAEYAELEAKMPCETLYADILGPLPPSEMDGKIFQAILVVYDKFSKYTW